MFADVDNSVSVQIIGKNEKEIPMKMLASAPTPETEFLLAKGSNGTAEMDNKRVS